MSFVFKEVMKKVQGVEDSGLPEAMQLATPLRVAGISLFKKIHCV